MKNNRKNIIPSTLLINWTLLKLDNLKIRDKCGIYIIKNKINNKIYIGSSKQLLKRIQEHRCRFRKQDGINQHILNAYNKYGEDNFEYSIVEFCSVDIILDRELFYLTSLEPSYNITLLVIANKGLPRSEISKQKCSDTLRQSVKEGLIASKKVYIYNIDTYKLCKKCESIKDARKILNIKTGSNIENSIFKKKYIIRSYKFDNLNELVNYIWKEVKFPLCGEYIVTSYNNVITYFQDVPKCAKANNVSTSIIYNHRDATLENPIKLPNGSLLYFTNLYIPLDIPKILIEESNELNNIKIKRGSV